MHDSVIAHTSMHSLWNQHMLLNGFFLCGQVWILRLVHGFHTGFPVSPLGKWMQRIAVVNTLNAIGTDPGQSTGPRM